MVSKRFSYLSHSQNILRDTKAQTYQKQFNSPSDVYDPEKTKVGRTVAGLGEVQVLVKDIVNTVAIRNDRHLTDLAKNEATRLLQSVFGAPFKENILTNVCSFAPELNVTLDVTIQVSGILENEVKTVAIQYSAQDKAYPTMRAALPGAPNNPNARTYIVKVTVEKNPFVNLSDSKVLNQIKNAINQRTDFKRDYDRGHREGKTNNYDIRGDARFDRGYKEQINRAEGRPDTMIA